MTIEDVAAKLCELLGDYQDEAEKPKKPVKSGTRPLGDMAGFESDFIPEVVRRLAREVLGEPLPKGTREEHFRREGMKLTVEEIAESFSRLTHRVAVKV